jgi:hypothetical protein
MNSNSNPNILNVSSQQKQKIEVDLIISTKTNYAKIVLFCRAYNWRFPAVLPV